jgi:TonB family protein
MTDEPEQNSDSSPVSVPASDRRAHPRQRIRSLAYVHLGEGNGGIVLNISEGGIAVQAAEALDEGEGVIAMRIEIPCSRKRLEVRGEIMWVGESHKEAGLRFVDLQEDALRRIRSWMAREGSPGTAPEASEEEVEELAVRDAEVRAETVAIEAASVRRDEPVAQVEELAAQSEEQISEVDEPVEDDMEPVEFDEESVAFDEEPDEEPADASSVSPAEVAEAEALTMEAPAFAAAEKLGASASVIRKEEDRAPKIAPPAAPFEKKPQIPVAPYTPISGTHGASAFAVAAARPAPARYSSGDAAASLFPKPHVAVEGAAASADGGWKSFRVQLQSGWFLAALVLLLATISFVAGMAVRRGALNGMMGDVDDVVQPKSAPAASAGNLRANSAANGSSAAGVTAPAKPLQIEIVDLENHRWTIPAASGAIRGDAGAARPPQANESSPSDGGAPSFAASQVPAPNQNSAQGVASNGTASNGAAGAGAAAKPGAPLTLSLPETPISASGSIAIRATGMVPMPAGEAESGQHARNLQIGELTNLVEPVYPPDARQARLEGTVKLHVVVGANGEIQSFRTVSGPESLAQAAMNAVREWRYRPTLLNGKAVETQEDVTFVFRLPN